ncbi:IclR family transcriptional regulator [Nakamurella leprariae]|uniref:IclR family transcriptional regulator n=1 Tax=Nakamurella leprariae TaxID=2803911 RepID=A0A938YBB6_9ACTN|nr:IclR family transcriptional regulator [Nakamurella leprariae]MBM9466483.1 IclR family transcriptional regulator [Nakamurella leprariae]
MSNEAAAVGQEESGSSSGIERAVQIIMAVATTEEPDIGISELARQLSLSKAVVHRAVRTLVASGFFAVDERTRRYRLGPVAVSVGLTAMAKMDVPRIAAPHLDRLVTETRETATLSVRFGDERMYVSQVLSPQEIRMSVQLGILYPLYAGSSSKAILAAMPPEETDRYLRTVHLDPMTGSTIRTKDALRRELDAVRERGYAISLGERQAGAGSVAAAVMDAAGRVYGSLSVCGPVTRIGLEEAHDYGELVRDAAAEVSRSLGHRSLQAR